MFASLALTLTLVAAAPADVAVVCPAPFRATFQPWVEYRTAQGHVIAEVDAAQSPAEIKRRLHELFQANERLAIVLVGDAEPAADRDAALRARSVPAHLAEARVNVVFGSEPQIATDNWYADFDDDGVPEAAVGRLSVDTPEQLARLVARILAYERSADVGLWRRRINFIAGLGNFGPIADTALENAAKTLLTRFLPPGLDSTMTYASPTSPYCPGPTIFRDVAIGRFNEGCLMWVYIGHGQRREVDRIPTAAGWQPILHATDAQWLAPRRQPPLACFLSCYSGAYDGEQDCLAEEMLRADGGPIGVLCGSRVTMPYAMSILGQELMLGFFHDRPATLGEVFRTAKRNTVQKPRDDVESRQFDALATMLMPMAADLPAQRAEHLALFNLLGDPLLRLRHPEVVELTTAGEAVAGEKLKVSGSVPFAGKATIELVVRRDRLVFHPTGLSTPSTAVEQQMVQIETYRRANDPRLAGFVQPLPAGPFACEFHVPREAQGECHVRIYVEGDDAFAQGSANVKIRPAPRTQ
jgi:hypothetical protein